MTLGLEATDLPIPNRYADLESAPDADEKPQQSYRMSKRKTVIQILPLINVVHSPGDLIRSRGRGSKVRAMLE